jgi:Flp pilus assembly protein TadG
MRDLQRNPMSRGRPAARRGVAAVELAILLPFLAFIFVIAVDWSRIFYYSVTVSNCARNGALYAVDPYSTTKQPYTSVSQAALADAQNLSPPPLVATVSGVDGMGSYTDCTVTYTFSTISNFPGVKKSTTITRTVRVYTVPKTPN